MTTIIGIKLSYREKEAIYFQEILTKYGCQIRTRIGLHHEQNDRCTQDGIVLLDVTGNYAELKRALETYWQVKSIEFN